MINHKLLAISLCLLPVTKQENNTFIFHLQGEANVEQNEDNRQTIDQSDMPILSKEIRKNSHFLKKIQGRRKKRNLIRRFITKFKRSFTSDKETSRAASTGSWSFPPRYGVIPKNAFSAGLDIVGRRVFIGRGFVPGDKAVVPGRLQEYEVCVEVAWRGWGRCLGNYQVLVGGRYTWRPGHRDWFPYNYVVAGSQKTLEDGASNLFICRYYMRNENLTDQLMVGKVTRDGKCSVGYNGEESVMHSVYELLTHS